MRKDVLAGAAAAGAALVGGALVYYLREKLTDEPDYRAIASDGDFQIREYPAMTVAETVVFGPRKQALGDGHRALSNYISARTREGEQVPMMVPVMMDSGDPMASDPPLFDDQLQGGWRTRFMMPAGRSKADLPAPAEGVADAISFGRPFIANPDLVERIRRGAALGTPDVATFYSRGPEGYTDYRAGSEQEAA